MPDVFISYSRKDSAFVRSLQKALEGTGRDAWVDWQDIAPSADWLDEIRRAIEAADTFVFVISPDSLASRVCADELAHAVAQQKRLIPVVCRDAPTAAVPADLQRLNWVFFRLGDDFDEALATLVRAIDTDLEWVRAHTRLLVRALEWDRHRRGGSFLLRGEDLRAAEDALAGVGPDRSPQPTALQREYVLAGRRAQASGQRRILGGVSAGLVVVLILALVALLQRNTAVAQRREAVHQQSLSRSRELAAASVNALETDPALALLLAREAVRTETPEAERALRYALFSSWETRVISVPGLIWMDVTEDGSRIVTLTNAGTLEAWDATSGRRTIAIDAGPVAADIYLGRAMGAALSPDGTLVAVAAGQENRLPDGTPLSVAPGTAIRLWNLRTGAPAGTLRQREPAIGIAGAAFSPDGTRLAATSATNPTLSGVTRSTLTVWDLATMEPAYVIDAPGDEYGWPRYSPDGALLAAPNKQKQGKGSPLWDAQSGQEVGRLGAGDALVFGPGHASLLLTSGAIDVQIWDTSSQRGKLYSSGHRNAIADLAYSPDGRFFATASRDKTVRIIEAAREPFLATVVAELRGHTDTVLALRFAVAGNRLVTGGADGSVRLWDVRTLTPAVALGDYPGVSYGLAVSPDGTRLAVGKPTGAAQLWDLRSGERIAELSGHGDNVRALAFSPDGAVLLTGSQDRARLWDGRTGQPIGEVGGAGQPARGTTSAIFSPDGARLYLGARGQIDVYDPRSGARLAALATGAPADPSLRSPNDDLGALAVDADQGLVLALAQSGVLVGLDMASGAQRVRFSVGRAGIRSAGFSADGRLLATSGFENDVTVWDVRGQTRLRDFRGHSSYAGSLSFNPDATILLSGSDDGTVRLWEVATGRQVALFPSSGWRATFLPDGQGVFIPGVKGTSGVHRCEECGTLAGLRALAERRPSRALTCAERRQFLQDETACPTAAGDR